MIDVQEILLQRQLDQLLEDLLNLWSFDQRKGGGNTGLKLSLLLTSIKTTMEPFSLGTYSVTRGCAHMSATHPDSSLKLTKLSHIVMVKLQQCMWKTI